MRTKVLICIALSLIIAKMTCINLNTRSELMDIGRQLRVLDSISDFRSNRNHPVPKVENIGENLYQKLRSVRHDSLIFTVQTGYDGREIDADYVILFTRKDATQLAVKIRKVNNVYKILGYSGGTNW
jgi:hypothetical protein